MFFGTNIYRSTLIDYKIPTAIVFGVGLIAFKLNFKDFKHTFSHLENVFINMLAIPFYLSCGFIICTVLLTTNYYLAKPEIQLDKYEIVRTEYQNSVNRYKGITYSKSSKIPWFEINYNGKSKMIVFDKSEYIYKDGYTHIEMVTKNGFLGFDIVLSKKLIAVNIIE